jgi:DNA segregation ATPase FtsK/SpoIIIE-like protein
VRWRLDDETGLGVVGRVDVLRAPPQSALADRRQELWTEIATTVVGDGSWRAIEDALTGRVTMEHWVDPLRVVVDYPVDARPTHRSIPFGIDEDGNEVTLGLIETNVLLGGVPGGGKSGGLTAYLVGIAQLPHVALIGLDPKMVELSLHRPRASYISVRDEETLAVLALVRDEMERRYAWLADHGLKKVTVDLLSDDMPLLIVVIDELADLVSVGVTKEEKAADQQRSTLIRRLIAKGRAAGVVVVAATQKPQADVVPTALRDLIQLRVAYATTNAAMTDTILGAGMSGLGGEAHTIPQSLRGVCYVVGETDRHPVRARTYWVPDEEVAGIAQQHAGLRVDLPWLTTDAVEQIRAELSGEPTPMSRRTSAPPTPKPRPQPAPPRDVDGVVDLGELELELSLDDLEDDDPPSSQTPVGDLWD